MEELQMTLVKWNPRTLDREINQLLKTVWGEPSLSGGRRSGWVPTVDVAELDDRYEVLAEHPV
jgi:HSP20 family molecular chaperone IbpA